jgi:hypothetical protein
MAKRLQESADSVNCDNNLTKHSGYGESGHDLLKWEELR